MFLYKLSDIYSFWRRNSLLRSWRGNSIDRKKTLNSCREIRKGLAFKCRVFLKKENLELNATVFTQILKILTMSWFISWCLDKSISHHSDSFVYYVSYSNLLKSSQPAKFLKFCQLPNKPSTWIVYILTKEILEILEKYINRIYSCELLLSTGCLWPIYSHCSHWVFLHSCKTNRHQSSDLLWKLPRLFLYDMELNKKD